jgi:hypothetical protein
MLPMKDAMKTGKAGRIMTAGKPPTNDPFQ